MAPQTSQPDLLDPDAAARFFDNVRVGSADDCWHWVGDTGTREVTGHVRVWYQGIRIYAHRLAYLLAGGVIEEGEVVRHFRCDQPDCMNALHLRAGTVADNVRDRDIRNRRTPFLPRGEAHWSSKLTDADAMRIRAAKKLGLNAYHLAAMYNLSRSTVYNVWGGVSYPAELPASEMGTASASGSG